MSETLLPRQREDTFAILQRHNDELCHDPCGLRVGDETQYFQDRTTEILDDIFLQEAGGRVAICIDSKRLPQLTALYKDIPLKGTITNVTFEQNLPTASQSTEGLILTVEPEDAESARIPLPLALDDIRTMEDAPQ